MTPADKGKVMLRDRMRRKLLSSSEECLGMADMGEIGESAVYPKYNAGKTPIQSCGQETRRHRHRRPARASPAAIMFAKSLQNPYRTPTLESRHAPNRPPAPAPAADGLRRRCGHLLRRPRQQRPHADDTAFAGVFLERRGDGAAAGLAPAGLPAPLRSRHHASRRRGNRAAVERRQSVDAARRQAAVAGRHANLRHAGRSQGRSGPAARHLQIGRRPPDLRGGRGADQRPGGRQCRRRGGSCGRCRRAGGSGAGRSASTGRSAITLTPTLTLKLAFNAYSISTTSLPLAAPSAISWCAASAVASVKRRASSCIVSLPASTSLLASRMMAPCRARPLPDNSGSSVNTPEYVAARNDSGASAWLPQPRQLTTWPPCSRAARNEASSVAPPTVS